MKLRIWIVGLAASCAYHPSSRPATSGDSGSGTTFVDCTGFVAPPFVPGTCPGGGLVTDLVVDLRARDESEAPCSVCAAGDITFDVVAVNPCAVDVVVDTPCLVSHTTIDAPSISGWVTDSTTFSCTAPTTPNPVRVPAGSESPVSVHRFSGVDPGVHRVTMDFLYDLPSAGTAICVE